MASIQEIMSQAVAGLKAEAVSAVITLTVALLMWFAVLPLHKSQRQKKVDVEVDDGSHQNNVFQKCLTYAQNRVHSPIAQGVLGTLAAAMLARCLKMSGAFEQPLLVLPVAFVLGGFARLWSCSRQALDTVEYPDDLSDESMTGCDSCHHTGAFWSDLEPTEKESEQTSLSPSDILSDVLLPLLSDTAVAPIMDATRSSYVEEHIQSVEARATHVVSRPTQQLMAGSLVFAVTAVCWHFCGASNHPMLVLPFAFLLGGLARFMLLGHSDALDDLVEYPECTVEEFSDEEPCHHSSAFWADLEPEGAKLAEDVPQSSEILSGLLLSYMNDPVVSSIFMAQ